MRATSSTGKRPSRHARDAGMEDFPGSARIWIFGTDRELDAAETGELLGSVDGSWRRGPHGVPLRATRPGATEFPIRGVDLEHAPPSGCSIDALVHRLPDLEQRLGHVSGDETVWYRDDEAPSAGSRPEFPRLRATAG